MTWARASWSASSTPSARPFAFTLLAFSSASIRSKCLAQNVPSSNLPQKTPFISFPNRNHHCCVLIWAYFFGLCDPWGWGSRPLPLPLKRTLGGPAAQQIFPLIEVVKGTTTNIPGLWRHSISPHPSLVRPASCKGKKAVKVYPLSSFISIYYVANHIANLHQINAISILDYIGILSSVLSHPRHVPLSMFPALHWPNWWFHLSRPTTTCTCFPCTRQVTLFFSPRKFGIARRCQASNPWSLPPDTAELECNSKATNKMFALRRWYIL